MKLLIFLFIAAVHAQGDPPPDGPPLVVPFDELVAGYNLTFIGEYWNVSYWCEYADRKKKKKTKKTKSKKKKSSSKKKSSKKSKKKSKKKGKGSAVYCPTEDELIYTRWERELCAKYILNGVAIYGKKRVSMILFCMLLRSTTKSTALNMHSATNQLLQTMQDTTNSIYDILHAMISLLDMKEERSYFQNYKSFL